jgi:hypothetical protein
MRQKRRRRRCAARVAPQALDGKAVEWLEKVGDAQYRA